MSRDQLQFHCMLHNIATKPLETIGWLTQSRLFVQQPDVQTFCQSCISCFCYDFCFSTTCLLWAFTMFACLRYCNRWLVDWFGVKKRAETDNLMSVWTIRTLNIIRQIRYAVIRLFMCFATRISSFITTENPFVFRTCRKSSVPLCWIMQGSSQRSVFIK